MYKCPGTFWLIWMNQQNIVILNCWSRRLARITHGGVLYFSWPLLTHNSFPSFFFFPCIAFHPLQGYPGGWFLVNNLILTPLGNLCKTNGGSDYLNLQYSASIWSLLPGPTLVPWVFSKFSNVKWNVRILLSSYLSNGCPRKQTVPKISQVCSIGNFEPLSGVAEWRSVFMK